MNNEPTERIGIPDVAPTNPYAQPESSGSDYAPPGDPTAKGLDGDAIDSLLRSRFIEGKRMGWDEGRLAAARSYPVIYDEGYRRGAAEFAEVGLSTEAENLRPALLEALEVFRRIQVTTGSATIKELCAAASGELVEKLG